MLPDRKDIKDLFEGLLGRDVDVTDGKPVDIGIPRPVVATYIDDYNHLRGLAVLEFGLAARVGAAIALVPMGAVEVAEEDRLLPLNLFENASEICNVLAAPFGEAMGDHLRLAEVYSPADPIPAHILTVAAQVAAREDVRLNVAGYGSGDLSIIVKV